VVLDEGDEECKGVHACDVERGDGEWGAGDDDDEEIGGELVGEDVPVVDDSDEENESDALDRGDVGGGCGWYEVEGSVVIL
jgi:hypothetical protein